MNLSIYCFIAYEVIRLTAWGIFAVASDYFKTIELIYNFDVLKTYLKRVALRAFCSLAYSAAHAGSA
jgi:hypothetical protein